MVLGRSSPPRSPAIPRAIASNCWAAFDRRSAAGDDRDDRAGRWRRQIFMGVRGGARLGPGRVSRVAEEVATRPFFPNCSNCSRTAATTFRAQLIGKSLFYKNNPTNCRIAAIAAGVRARFQKHSSQGRLKSRRRRRSISSSCILLIFESTGAYACVFAPATSIAWPLAARTQQPGRLGGFRKLGLQAIEQ
jgi:hypothetical protein